ncbi:MAG: hypothetical protein HQL41_18400, partial [Alphaproteobacteria bacterium]|nr:hypothetical protein [Alphaproteobacteria bacterium]
MSLDDVVAALDASLSPSGQIDLYAASISLTALAPVTGLLKRFTITSGFVLSGASLAPLAGAVVLTGSGRWGLPGAPAVNIVDVTVGLTCRAVAGSGVAFALGFEVAQAGWTFGTTFAGLPPTQEARGSIVVTVPSFLTTTTLDDALFTAASDETDGLTLSGGLPMTPFWGKWAGVVGPWPLRVKGRVVAPAAYDAPPELDLGATSATSQLRLRNAHLDFAPDMALTDMGFDLVSAAAANGEAAASVLYMGGTLKVGRLVARLRCPILACGRIWPFVVQFPVGQEVDGMRQLADLFGLPELPVPEDFPPIPSFRFRSVEFHLASAAGAFTVAYVACTIESTESWTSIAPFVTIERVGISWLWSQTRAAGVTLPVGCLSATVYGALAFGAPGDPFHIDCALEIPAWAGTARLREGDVIPIGKAFTNYFGSPGPATPPGMNVTQLVVSADPWDQSYNAAGDIVFGTPPTTLGGGAPPPQGWVVTLGTVAITLERLSFEIAVVGGEVAGGLGAVFVFDYGAAKPPVFGLSAQFTRDTGGKVGWVFSGALQPGGVIALTDLVARFVGQNPPPAWVPDLSIDRLSFTFNTGDESFYHFAGTISGRWQPTIFNATTLTVSAEASVEVEMAPGQAVSGRLSGTFLVQGLSLTTELALGVAEPTYRFQVAFRGRWFQAQTAWIGQGTDRHEVITAQMGGFTLGQALEYLVDLAAPTLGYRLDPPWDVLNDLDMSRFVLTIDPRENAVELAWTADADLVFMRLNAVAVRWRRGQNGGVTLAVTGELLGRRYDDDSLSWNVIDEAPPPVPGQGPSYIRPRYLGLGQRVQLDGTPRTVSEGLARLASELGRVEPGGDPLANQGVVWNPEAQWLIGLDIGLMDTVDLGVLFCDPILWGVRVALRGPNAGGLAGLAFEILYRKIDGALGVYHGELVVPTAYRTLELGEISVTLGKAVVDVYTNGDFAVDLGFPWNGSYQDSFTVEAFPFLGRGGIRFGRLSGGTSSRVPRVANGDFAPV